VQPSDRVMIAGATESGKSYLASAIANRWDRVLVFDPKGTDDLPNAAICYGVDAARKAIPGRVIYRPTADELADVAAAFDERVEKIWNRGGHHAILSHESAMLGNANRGFAPYYTLAHLQGRSMFVPVIDCSQRPVGIPRETISEATHVVCFYLADERDRLTMATSMGDVVKAPMQFSHDYWYTGRDKITRRLAAI
jgi:hypothetical protein